MFKYRAIKAFERRYWTTYRTFIRALVGHPVGDRLVEDNFVTAMDELLAKQKRQCGLIKAF